MNVNMWDHPATQANLELLRQRGVRVIERAPASWPAARSGTGRMAEPDAIAETVLHVLGTRHDLAGEVVLVTAEAPAKPLTPSASSVTAPAAKWATPWLKRRRAAARASSSSAGPSALHPPAHCELIKITTAEQMRQAVLERMGESTLIVKAAAVADYRAVPGRRPEDEAHRPHYSGTCAHRGHSCRSRAPPPSRPTHRGLCRRDPEPHGKRPRQAPPQGRRRHRGQRRPPARASALTPTSMPPPSSPSPPPSKCP